MQRSKRLKDMQHNPPPRQGALGFASLGYGVFPLHGIAEHDGKLSCTCGDASCTNQGKHPFARLAPRGFKDATADLAKIKAWPHAWLNYGITTDPFVVIDVDPRHGGTEEWQKLYRRPTRGLPHTWEAVTGGGGRHIFFANPTGVKCGKIGKGVDVKAIGGYVVGVGSRHVSGKHYRWAPQCSPAEAKLADPPPWLLEEIAKTTPSSGEQGERRPPEFWDEILGQEFVNGTRNESYLRIAGHLIGCGVDPAIAWCAIRCINVCSPDPEDEAKLRGVFDRVCALECDKRGLR
jgi:Bifunctional DNA primase/polymerase, N-terminal